MDTNICGLNKVVCKASSSSYSGRMVTITNGVNTWSGNITNITGIGYACVFMVPSLPAPAKRTYTVSLYNSSGTSPEYQRDIELGFGDSIVIGLYTNAEIADKAYVLSEITSHAYTLPTASSSTKGGIKVGSSSSTNGLYMSGESLMMSKAGSSSLGVVKPGAGLSVDNNGTLSLRVADTVNVGGVIIGSGLKISSGTVSVKAAGTSSSNVGGVYVRSGKGISLDSDGEIYLSTPGSSALGGVYSPSSLSGLQINSGNLSVKAGNGISINSSGVNVYFAISSMTISVGTKTVNAGYTTTVSITHSLGQYAAPLFIIVKGSGATKSHFVAAVDSWDDATASIRVSNIYSSSDSFDSLKINYLNFY